MTCKHFLRRVGVARGGGGGAALHLPSAIVLPARKIPEDGLRVGVWGLGFGVWGLGCGEGILVVPVNEKHIGSDLKWSVSRFGV